MTVLTERPETSTCVTCGGAITMRGQGLNFDDWVHTYPAIAEQPEYCYPDGQPWVAEPADEGTE